MVTVCLLGFGVKALKGVKVTILVFGCQVEE